MYSSKVYNAAFIHDAASKTPGAKLDRGLEPAQLKLWIEPYISTDIVVGPFTINDCSKIVYIEDKRCKLSPKEYKLLKRLALEPGRVVSNEELISELWQPHSNASTNDVKQYVHLLRRRIEPNPQQPRWIENVRGFGYRLAIDGANADQGRLFSPQSPARQRTS